MYSLRTRSKVIATSRAQRAAQTLDEHWYHLRIRDVDLPGKHLLRIQAHSPSGLPVAPEGATEGSLKLSEAVGIYLRLKGQGRPITFHRAA